MVRVIDSNGATRKSTVIKGLLWAVQNRTRYNIRVLFLAKPFSPLGLRHALQNGFGARSGAFPLQQPPGAEGPAS